MARTTFTGPVKSLNGFEGDFTGGTDNLALTGTLSVDGVSTLTGAVDAPGGVTGDLTGNVTGDLTGNVTGDVTGNVTGDVTGNVTGDVDGILGGNTPAAATVTDLTASGTVIMSALPTSDPTVAGQLWNDSGTVKVSAGA